MFVLTSVKVNYGSAERSQESVFLWSLLLRVCCFLVCLKSDRSHMLQRQRTHAAAASHLLVRKLFCLDGDRNNHRYLLTRYQKVLVVCLQSGSRNWLIPRFGGCLTPSRPIIWAPPPGMGAGFVSAKCEEIALSCINGIQSPFERLGTRSEPRLPPLKWIRHGRKCVLRNAQIQRLSFEKCRSNVHLWHRRKDINLLMQEHKRHLHLKPQNQTLGFQQINIYCSL